MQYISGDEFKYQVEDRLKNIGWVTYPEQSYIDDIEPKQRTIDIVATKEVRSFNPRGNQIALVIECKYLDHDVSTHLRPNPVDKNAYFIDGHNKDELFIVPQKFHFLSTTKIAHDVNDQGNKKDSLYGAIMQASKALLYLRHEPLLYKKGLFIPVVFYRGSGKIKDQKGIELENLLVYRSHAWKNPKDQNVESRNLYVDVVHEKHLETYIRDICEKEMDTVMELAYFRHKMEENRKRQPRSNPGL